MNDDFLSPRRFVVVGAGGTGGWLINGLARTAEYRLPGSILVIVDGDTFEPDNADRQDFQALGNKATVRAEQLRPQFPNTFIVDDPRWVVEHSSADVNDMEAPTVAASTLLREGDLVYAVVDNFAARKTLFDAAQQFDNIDVFTGGNDEELFGSVYHYARRNGENFTDHPVDWQPELINPPDRNPGELSCEERAQIDGGVQTIAANMAVAAFLLGRTYKLLEGEEDTEAEIMFDIGVGHASASDRRVEVTEGSEHSTQHVMEAIPN